MISQNRIRPLAAIAALLVLSLPSFSQQQAKRDKQKVVPTGTPVLWRDPGDVSSLDLLTGPGGEEMKPDLSSLTFIEEQKGGYSKKYRVRDDKGRVWVAKIGKEAQPETAANRLLWAAGYMTEITHLAPSTTIPGKGTFENVRFEARPEEVERAGEWRWDRNPFTGTREFNGLKILMALIENWDLKDSNNQVLSVKGELHHVVSDLGATFGKTGGQNSPMALLRQVKGSRNEPGDYVSDKFIEAVEGGHVRFDFSGKNSGLMRGIPVSDARWLGEILSRLSDRQIEDAFRAANYTPDVVRLLTAAVRSRINELANVR